MAENDTEGEEELVETDPDASIEKIVDESKNLTSGIIYLSRIPPYMKPAKVRHLFSRYGAIGRVYLQPEGKDIRWELCAVTNSVHYILSIIQDPFVRKRRRRFGGNKKLKFTEGWVEFEDKRVAKRVSLLLNNTIVGGKKASYYHDDIWNIKYLSKFRWTHLSEKIGGYLNDHGVFKKFFAWFIMWWCVCGLVSTVWTLTFGNILASVIKYIIFLKVSG